VTERYADGELFALSHCQYVEPRAAPRRLTERQYDFLDEFGLRLDAPGTYQFDSTVIGRPGDLDVNENGNPIQQFRLWTIYIGYLSDLI
jgi:hypothetical protein